MLCIDSFVQIVPPYCLALLNDISRFLPETLRAIVGNGSQSPEKYAKFYYPLIPYIGNSHPKPTQDKNPSEKGPKIKPGFINPFLLFIFPDVAVTLLFTGIVYAVNYTITASMASAFHATYPYLSETSLGLCYLSTGGGMLVGSTITGKLLDREYRVLKAKWDKGDEEKLNTEEQKEDFPIELARLRTMPLHLVVFVACCFAWGWCLERKVSIAAPLIFQVICKSSELR